MSIKNILVVLCIFSFLLTSCNKETLQDKVVAVPEKLTWADYYKYCSSENLYKEANFKKLKETEVVWKGRISEIKDKPDMKELGGRGDFHTQVLMIRMDPADGLFADLELRLKKELAEEIKIFKEDDLVEFKATVKFIGSSMSPTVLNMSAIRRAKEEVIKKKKRKNPFK